MVVESKTTQPIEPDETYLVQSVEGCKNLKLVESQAWD